MRGFTQGRTADERPGQDSDPGLPGSELAFGPSLRAGAASSMPGTGQCPVPVGGHSLPARCTLSYKNNRQRQAISEQIDLRGVYKACVHAATQLATVHSLVVTKVILFGGVIR